MDDHGWMDGWVSGWMDVWVRGMRVRVCVRACVCAHFHDLLVLCSQCARNKQQVLATQHFLATSPTIQALVALSTSTALQTLAHPFKPAHAECQIGNMRSYILFLDM